MGLSVDRHLLNFSRLRLGRGLVTNDGCAVRVVGQLRSIDGNRQLHLKISEKANFWSFLDTGCYSLAERKNRALKKMINALVISSSLPRNLGGGGGGRKASLTDNKILNRVPIEKYNQFDMICGKEGNPT